jgi:hypothetical protein
MSATNPLVEPPHLANPRRVLCTSKVLEGPFILKALVAGEIRRSQLMADENSAFSRKGSAENELQELHGFARAPREPVGIATSATYGAEEPADKTRIDKKSA